MLVSREIRIERRKQGPVPRLVCDFDSLGPTYYKCSAQEVENDDDLRMMLALVE